MRLLKADIHAAFYKKRAGFILIINGQSVYFTTEGLT
jgi:hypothetical protein